MGVKVKKSPKPSGVKISKSLNSFTCTWKGSYDEKINFRWFLNYKGGKNRSASIKKATTESLPIKSTSKKKTLNYKTKREASSTSPWHDSLRKYIPYTDTALKNVRFEVQGKKKNLTKKKKKKTVVTQKNTMSSWNGKTFPFATPKPPMVSFERNDVYRTTFSINLPKHVTNKKWFGTHIEFQTVLRIDKNDKAGSSIPTKVWKGLTAASEINAGSKHGKLTRQYLYDSVTGQNITSFTKTINDIDNSTSITNAKTSAVRWFRARVVGPPGRSKWVYAYVSYSDPYPAVITKASAVRNSNNGYDCSVVLKYSYWIGQPIDEIIVQYAFANLGAIYDYYEITDDSEIDASKTYYTLQATEVPTGSISIDNIDKYYNKVDESFYLTEDEEVDEDTVYYIRETVSSPMTSHISEYYVYTLPMIVEDKENPILSWDYVVDEEELSRSETSIELDLGVIYVFRLTGTSEVEFAYNSNVYEVGSEVRKTLTVGQFYGTSTEKCQVEIILNKNSTGVECTVVEEASYSTHGPDGGYGYELCMFTITTRDLIDGYFSKPITPVINPHQTYYTFSAVANPVDADLDKYYVPSEYPHYYKSEDDYIDSKKKYYTVVATKVVSPIETDIHTYYEKLQDIMISPDDPQWQDAPVGDSGKLRPTAAPSILTEKMATVPFSIYGDIPPDQLLYARAVVVHNGKRIEGKYFQFSSQVQNVVLLPPTIENVELGSDNRLQITATNNSEANGVYLAVVFISDSGDDNSQVIYVYQPNGTESMTKTVEYPSKYIGSSFGIGMYAFLGTYSYDTIETDEEDYSYDLYNVQHTIKSKTVTYGGNIPVPPTNVEAIDLGDGNVQVSWDWNWKEADYAEVAWSDYSEALYSTEPPSNYTVPNSKTNRLIVRDLEAGKTWYFWVRLVKNENASAWSDYQSVGLTSSPSIPKLSLSKRYIKISEKFTANWTYVTNDNTPQAMAWLVLCSNENGEIVYNEDHLVDIPGDEQPDKEAQHVVLSPLELGWTEGTTYNLALKVQSESDRISEDWSNYASITVVAPINSIIKSTSLYPMAFDYDSHIYYQQGSYVWRKTPDPDDDAGNGNEIATLYKCVSGTDTAGDWDENNWIIDEEFSRQELRELPLTLVVEPIGGVTRIDVLIERSDEHVMMGPDDIEHVGNEGEVIYQSSKITSIVDDEEDDDGLYLFEIEQEDLLSNFDDGASYNLIVQVHDNYGQVQESRYEFMVNWDHQAIMPTGSVHIDPTYNVAILNIGEPEMYYLSSDLDYVAGKIYYVRTGDGSQEDPYVYTEVAEITGNPTELGWYEKEEPREGDICDIYRISADGFEVLYSDAEFNSTYVDPYPTIGDHGGYRIVYRTLYGDYTTKTNDFAWIDLDDEDNLFSSPSHIIDFGGDTVELMYNVNIDNQWSKQFQETHYLGGSIQGDWISGVSKTVSIKANVLTRDWDVVSDLRKLAAYEGECHIRTRDGSNFLANVEVSESFPFNSYYDPEGNETNLCEYSLNITRLDPIETDGLTYEEWLDTLPSETP